MVSRGSWSQLEPNTTMQHGDRQSGQLDDKAELLENDEEYQRRKQREKKCDCSFDACWEALVKKCRREKEYYPRTVYLGRRAKVQRYPANVTRNQKYNIITFIPLVLFEQFRLFLNLVFLIMALSQFIPSLRVGYLYTYWAPLGFVIFVTMCREAVDDLRRWKRDREVNGTKYKKLTRAGPKTISSSEIEVGDLIIVDKNQRVPADMVLARTSEKTGSCFIRTDQLDGETDWKLRLAIPTTQRLSTDEELFDVQAQVFAEKPSRDIHNFVGSFTRTDGVQGEDPLTVENTLWSQTVVASGTAVGLVIYTGPDTRAVMNSAQPRSKLGLVDIEINNITKLLVVSVIVLSFIMLSLKGFGGSWYKYLLRFVLLFAYIIPLALRVNLDMAKITYAFMIVRDKEMPDNIVRSTTIPEELGRIKYLLSDKTGTLTQNEMIFKKVHLGSVSFGSDSMDEVSSYIANYFVPSRSAPSDGKVRRTVADRVVEAVQAIALCHNVTPVFEETGEGGTRDQDTTPEAERPWSERPPVSYQASSPDEVALVAWSESVGLALTRRDLHSMQLECVATGMLLHYRILQIFPFTSETKRMGIIVQKEDTGEISFFMKGADVVMSQIVTYSDWLDEETGNMAREGLRTLVVGKKSLTNEQYLDFEQRYHQAKMSTQDRNEKVAAVVATLERDLDLLCLTGVEDRLQESVRPTLEVLRNAGIRVWMLTGDKLETAECIAKSSRLVARNQSLHIFQRVAGRAEAHLELNAFRRRSDSALIITGESLQVCLKFYEHEFVELACQCPAVVVCRCSPTQKAAIVRLLKQHTGKRVAAIGDGGNDVSMILAADVGVGLVGKEGRQASLASDFSLTQFSHLSRLLMVHGRNCYKNTASLSQFIIHRGIIISVMQAVFSAVFFFVAIPLFPGFLNVGYATVFTMFPVFSLVLDKDVTDKVALTYPELYKELTKGRDLNFKTFFVWTVISMYQGGVIMYGALLLFEDDFIHVVSITFTSLILTELLMVALTIRTWHILMVVGEILSLACYVLALIVLKDYFGECPFSLPVVTACRCLSHRTLLSIDGQTPNLVHALLFLLGSLLNKVYVVRKNFRSVISSTSQNDISLDFADGPKSDTGSSKSGTPTAGFPLKIKNFFRRGILYGK